MITQIDLHIKDLNNAIDTAHTVGAPLPLTAEVMEMLATLSEDFDIALLRDALSAEETIFRFKGHAPWGDSTQYDYILTAANRQEITDVLNAYDLMRSVSPEVLRKALA